MMTIVNSSHVLEFATLLSIATLAVGCAAGGAEEAVDPQVGTATEAFTNGYFVHTWLNDVDFDTGLPASGWTCFLMGAGGSMVSGVGSGGFASHAGAQIESDGHWHMYNQSGFTGVHTDSGQLEPGPGSSIMCVPSASHQTPVAHWASFSNGGAAIRLASTSDVNLVCGLVAVVLFGVRART